MNTKQQSSNSKLIQSSDLKFKLTPESLDLQSQNKPSLLTTPLELPNSLFLNLQKTHVWLQEFGISTKEMENLPEFFSPENIQKNRFIYQKLRNYMIKAYWMSPKQKLLFTAVRRAVNGDVGSLLRLYKFLEKEKVINCQVSPMGKSKKSQKRSFMQAFEFPVKRFGDVSDEIEGKGKLKRIKQRVRISPFKSRQISAQMWGLRRGSISQVVFVHKSRR